MTSATQSVFAAMSGEPQSAEEIGRRCDPPVFRTTVSKTLNATHIPVRSKIARRESYRTTHGDTLSTSLTPLGIRPIFPALMSTTAAEVP
jgi:hypothetical protein